MFSTEDTIVAIATPPGRGALGIVRLSGPRAQTIARQLLHRRRPFEPRRAVLSTITAGDVRDQVIVTAFPAPGSYTGDDVVEISAHGSAAVLNAIVQSAVDAGARLAEPGEFTLRAYLNQKIDLPQAEAVVDLIEAVTPLQARAAFDQLSGTLTTAIAAIDARLFDLVARLEACVDFPDEGYHFIQPSAVAGAIDDVVSQIDNLLASARRGRFIREGIQIAIVGRPNAGKSSLFNVLVGAGRAIVTDVPGTTRDLVTETVDLRGLRATLVDTAGLRQSDDVVEREGIARSRQAMVVSDVILLLVDGTTPWSQDDEECLQPFDRKTVIVQTKVDEEAVWLKTGQVSVSSLTGVGIERLKTRIVDVAGASADRDVPAITNIRHVELLQRARDAVVAARAAVLDESDSGRALSEEFVLADLQAARQALESITGRRTPDDVLAYVFGRFCVGK